MPTFEQEWISPILEVYKKRKISEEYTIILGLNPLGQAVCRRLYENLPFETIFVFNSPSFSTWNRYPADMKPPVIPVQAMVSEDLMIIFGDVFVKEYEWMTDMLFFLRGHVPSRFVVALVSYDGPTVGQVISKKGERLLHRMKIPMGRSDFYDGLSAPLISLGPTTNLDPVILFVEQTNMGEFALQVDSVTIYEEQVSATLDMLKAGFDFHLAI
ncbi:MAG: hypothetical protein ACFFED_08190 [Candidatus Thorarchaeota archaeon]